MYTFWLSMNEHEALYKKAERSNSTTVIHSHSRLSQSSYKILIISNRKQLLAENLYLLHTQMTASVHCCTSYTRVMLSC